MDWYDIRKLGFISFHTNRLVQSFSNLDDQALGKKKSEKSNSQKQPWKRRGYPRKILPFLWPKSYDTVDTVSRELMPFIIKKIKAHEETLDDENPRDYLDFLILENRKNHDIGYNAIAMAIMGLYIAGVSDIKYAKCFFEVELHSPYKIWN